MEYKNLIERRALVYRRSTRLPLVFQELWKAIEEKFSDDSKKSDQADLKERALSTIFVSVTDNVLRKIAGEKSAPSV